MKKHFKKIFSLLLCLTMVFSLFQAQLLVPSAKSVAEWNAEINKLKKEQANEKAILDALRGKINAINAQIAAYNQKINGINSTINANKAQIKKNEQEIEGDKLAFKKRIRSI